MYDRAPRSFPLTVGCTSPHLGPGCYDLPSQNRQIRGERRGRWKTSLPSLRPRRGYAPFLSLASRGLEVISQNDEDDLPGPGSYEINRIQKNIKGGKSPQNKEKRFKVIINDTPGPGTYCQPPSLSPEDSKTKRPLKMPSARYPTILYYVLWLEEWVVKELIILCLFLQKIAGCIKYFRKSEAPSIPSQGQAFGYEEAEDGTLIKFSQPVRDSSLGPAYYQTVYNEAYPTLKYKGVHFGNLTEKRLEFKPQEGPGPAHYDIIPESAVHCENVNIKKEDKKKCVLYIPRYHEEIVLQEEKKEWYQAAVRLDFELACYKKPPPQEAGKKPEQNRQPPPCEPLIPSEYQDLVEVFSEKEYDTLPPHRLNDSTIELLPGAKLPRPKMYAMTPLEMEELQQYVNNNLARGFIEWAKSQMGALVLFKEKKDGSLHLCVDYKGLNAGIPGPGKYNIKSEFGKAGGIMKSEAQHVPFLSLSERFAPVKSYTPAPGTYDETRSALECLRRPCRSKSIPFGHTSVRFTEDTRLQTSPGPAFYNICNYRIATPNFKNVLTETKKKGAFGSTVPRLLYLVKREAFATPGPADYQAVPPPGSYEVHKSFEKSQGKSEYMPPRTAVARRRHAAFLSGTFRENALKTEDDIPGPGTYSPTVDQPGAKLYSGMKVWDSQEPRFKDSKDSNPGPASYELSPLLRDTVLKRTYNVTLNNPVMIRVRSSIFKPARGREDLFCTSDQQNSKK
ncbi:sperm-tail PG-rich repeat-containing protein 2 [Vipera latastei]